MKLSDELDHLAGLPASERPESGSFLASVLAEGPDPDQIRFRSAEVLRVVLGYGERTGRLLRTAGASKVVPD